MQRSCIAFIVFEEVFYLGVPLEIDSFWIELGLLAELSAEASEEVIHIDPISRSGEGKRATSEIARHGERYRRGEFGGCRGALFTEVF
jgi:hypothetical protein